MRLALVYAARFYQDGSGTFVQPAYGKYIDGLARHADRIILCGPVSDRPVQGSGYRLDLPDLEVVPLPYFERDVGAMRHLNACREGVARAFAEADLGSIMLPLGVLGPIAHAVGRSVNLPMFLHVVGDLREQWNPEDYGGWLRPGASAAVEVLERLQQEMIDSTFTFVQGEALRRKHEGRGADIREAMETTILDRDLVEGGRSGAPGSPVRLLYAGNLIRPKGVQVLLQALAEDVPGDLEWTLTVAGAGPMQPELESLAAGYGFAERVDFPGFQSLEGVQRLMDESDLFVFPSFGEGMPRVLLEAMARGLPIVATDVGGIAGVIDSGRNGLLVPSGSAPELARALVTVVRDPAMWRGFSAAGVETARGHTMDHYAAYMREELRVRGLWPS